MCSCLQEGCDLAFPCLTCIRLFSVPSFPLLLLSPSLSLGCWISRWVRTSPWGRCRTQHIFWYFEMCFAFFFFSLSQWLFKFVSLFAFNKRAWGSSTLVPGCHGLCLGWGMLEQAAGLAPCPEHAAFPQGWWQGTCPWGLFSRFCICPQTGSDGAVTGLWPELSCSQKDFSPLSRLDYVLSFLPKC